MINLLAVTIVVLVAFYTVLFGIENYRIKNFTGFVAVLILAVASLVIPFYMLFFKS